LPIPVDFFLLGILLRTFFSGDRICQNTRNLIQHCGTNKGGIPSGIKIPGKGDGHEYMHFIFIAP
jgi:hypothetical protein